MSNSSSSSPITVKDVVHKLQLCLLDGVNSETQLLVAGSLLSKSDYHDVITERSIAHMCGYPLCLNSLPSLSPSETPKKGRYRISLKEHKVYDLLETHMYCSTKCVADSRAFSESLEDERSLELDTGKIEKVARLFEGFGLKAEEGLGENGDLGLRNLSIIEKEGGNGGGGVVSMEEWIGPSNAIEGYVPQHERRSNNKPGSKLKDSKLKREEEERIFNEMNFMSTIITQDNEYSISKKPSSQTKKKTNRKGTNDQLTESGGSSRNTQNVPETKLNELKDEKREIVTNHEPNGLKSSLKSSGAIRSNRSVTWADEKNEVSDNQKIDDADVAFRLASAEACVEALTKAAEAVASGESDAPDAVSEAGLVILPPPLDDNETVSPEPAPLKWPTKTGIVESDFLDSEDSWFDSPPEEFVVDLSPFATMFMSLFSWISTSTLAYLYGHDDNSHEEYGSVNGREYLRKIVLSDGRSSEIKQTLAGCLSRALPGIIHDLRLPTPVSTVESGMGCILETMSFLDPLPPLRMKQWQVIVMLFVEALSVSRIPALSPHLTNRRSFFQKVFDDGSVSREEYEVLKDLMLPLGRVPQFAPQSGG